MFDRSTEILEITRKICPRGVQNRKSNKKKGRIVRRKVRRSRSPEKLSSPKKGSIAIKAIRSDWIIYRRSAINEITPTGFAGIREIFLRTREESDLRETIPRSFSNRNLGRAVIIK